MSTDERASGGLIEALFLRDGDGTLATQGDGLETFAAHDGAHAGAARCAGVAGEDGSVAHQVFASGADASDPRTALVQLFGDTSLGGIGIQTPQV